MRDSRLPSASGPRGDAIFEDVGRPRSPDADDDREQESPRNRDEWPLEEGVALDENEKREEADGPPQEGGFESWWR